MDSEKIVREICSGKTHVFTQNEKGEIEGDYKSVKTELFDFESPNVEDFGIGPYEHGSQRGVHHDWGVEDDDLPTVKVEVKIPESLWDDAEDLPEEIGKLFVGGLNSPTYKYDSHSGFDGDAPSHYYKKIPRFTVTYKVVSKGHKAIVSTKTIEFELAWEDQKSNRTHYGARE